MKAPSDRCPHDLAPLLSFLLDGKLSDQQRETLQNLLRQDADCRRYYLRFIHVHAATQWVLGQASPQQRATEQHEANADEDWRTGDLDAFLAMLAQLDDPSDELVPVNLTERLASERQALRDARMLQRPKAHSPRFIGLAVRLYPRAAILTAIAAVLLFGVTLYLAFNAGNETASTPKHPALAQPTPGGTDTPTRPVVATLTNTHNAQWAQGASAPGSPLRPGDALAAGQRLNLIQGFAQITTARGAVALIEAPATIELTNNDNAIELHAGKLVGICETASSKGFTVHTPHIDITDLGTRYGVDSAADATNVLVFEGSVELLAGGDTASTTSQPLRLDAGWASSMRAGDASLGSPTPISDRDRAGFVQRLDELNDPGFAYRRAVLAGGPVAYWDFAGDTTTALTSRSTGAEQLQLLGQAGLTSSDGRQWLSLPKTDGQASYAQLPGTSDALAGASAYTIECWARPSEISEGALISLFPEFDPQALEIPSAMILHLHDPDLHPALRRTLRFVHRNPPVSVGPTEANTDSAYRSGQWLHIVGVKTPEEVRVYLNGKLVASQPDATPMTQDPLRLWIGYHRGGNGQDRQFVGDLDEIAFYPHELTEDQILNHLELGKDLFHAGPIPPKPSDATQPPGDERR